uniref:Par3/HAL N-terminal domain-containing protein n=1 Tax=Cyclopterus lumpus TaxID=8103 RepID=A0A8C2WFB2_CYCLU
MKVTVCFGRTGWSSRVEMGIYKSTASSRQAAMRYKKAIAKLYWPQRWENGVIQVCVCVCERVCVVCVCVTYYTMSPFVQPLKQQQFELQI